MKRKIIKLAEKTLVVSLPSSWTSACQIQKGDEVEVTINDASLCIHPILKQRFIKKITVDISTLSPRVLRWQVSSLHKQGYDEIELLHYSKEQEDILADLVQHLFVGFIVKEKSSIRLVVGQVAIVDSDQFAISLRQAWRQLVSSSKDLSLAFSSKDPTLFKNILISEQDNNKLTNLCERLLNKSLTQKEKGHFWYVVAWNLEKIVDNFKYIASYFHEAIISISSQTQELLNDFSGFVQGYYDLFYNFSFEKLSLLSEQKILLHKKALSLLASQETTSPHENILLHFIDCAILQTADFSTSTIALMFSFKEK